MKKNKKTIGRYVLRVDYKTGDSYGQRDDFEIMDYGWDSYELACMNARAIHQHALYYRKYEKYGDGFHVNNETAKNKCRGRWWYVEPADGDVIDAKMYLLSGKNEKTLFVCPWCGYFENFKSVEVQFNFLKLTEYDDCD